MSETRTPTVYKVPAGTKPTRCRGATCGMMIYFVRNSKTGNMVPVSCDVEGGRRPSAAKDSSQLDLLSGETEVHDGRGISHFNDCKDVDQFSRSR